MDLIKLVLIRLDMPKIRLERILCTLLKIEMIFLKASSLSRVKPLYLEIHKSTNRSNNIVR